MSEFFRRFKDLLWSWILRNVFGYTGKSLSEALIFASTNPQYDNRLFNDIRLIINRLSTEVLFIRVINYFGGSFQSKVLYKFGFFEGILRDF